MWSRVESLCQLPFWEMQTVQEKLLLRGKKSNCGDNLLRWLYEQGQAPFLALRRNESIDWSWLMRWIGNKAGKHLSWLVLLPNWSPVEGIIKVIERMNWKKYWDHRVKSNCTIITKFKQIKTIFFKNEALAMINYVIKFRGIGTALSSKL